jgi:hypothetical protein
MDRFAPLPRGGRREVFSGRFFLGGICREGVAEFAGRCNGAMVPKALRGLGLGRCAGSLHDHARKANVLLPEPLCAMAAQTIPGRVAPACSAITSSN